MHPQDKTQFDVAFTELLENFSKLQITHSTINSSHEREKIIREQSQNTSTNTFSSSHNMSYRDIQTNKFIPYDYKELSTEDLNLNMLSILNHQYQWIFINSFEHFEKFIEKCKSEVSQKSCIELPKKNGLHRSLEYLRKHLPELSKTEIDNHNKINYRSTIALIEHLRHIMTHNGGKVIRIEDFKIRLNEKIQCHNNGQNDQGAHLLLKIFLPEQHDGKDITLTKIYSPNNFMHYIDPLGEAIGWLLTYSSHLNKLLNIWLSRINLQHP